LKIVSDKNQRMWNIIKSGKEENFIIRFLVQLLVHFPILGQACMVMFFPYLTFLLYRSRQTSSYEGLTLSPDFDQENRWGIGQLVPMVLLVLPFLAAIQGYIG